MSTMQQSTDKIYNRLATSFHTHSDELAAMKHQLVHSADVREVFVGILLTCQSGDFSNLGRLPELLRRYDDWLFWKAVIELLGYAGSWSLIDRVFQEFQGEVNDGETQYFLSIALADSCGVWAVEPLLSLHAAAVEQEPRYQIERQLSYLLEQENDLIWIGAEEMTIVRESEHEYAEDRHIGAAVNYESFANEVRNTRNQVVQSVGSLGTPVFEGRMLDVADTARRLYDRLTSEDKSQGRLDRERMLFEAFTGVDTSDFYNDAGQLQRLPAAAIMENFLENDAVAYFEPGRRYFFGHPISE